MAQTQQHSNDLLAYQADQLGKLRAQVKDLQDRAKDLEASLKESGESVIDGAAFHITVSRSERTTVDWKGIAAKLNPSRQLVTAHSTTKETCTLRVGAHKKS